MHYGRLQDHLFMWNPPLSNILQEGRLVFAGQDGVVSMKELLNLLNFRVPVEVELSCTWEKA